MRQGVAPDGWEGSPGSQLPRSSASTDAPSRKMLLRPSSFMLLWLSASVSKCACRRWWGQRMVAMWLLLTTKTVGTIKWPNPVTGGGVRQRVETAQTDESHHWRGTGVSLSSGLSPGHGVPWPRREALISYFDIFVAFRKTAPKIQDQVVLVFFWRC